MTEPGVLSQVLGLVALAAACYLLARAICYLAGDQWSDQ